MAIISKFVGCRCSQIIQPAAVGWRCRHLSQHLKKHSAEPSTVFRRLCSWHGEH